MKKYLLAVGLSLLLVACGGAKNGSNSQNKTENNKGTENVEVSEDVNNKNVANNQGEIMDNDKVWDVNISPEDAVKSFTDKYPEATINEVSLSMEDGIYKYEISAFDGTKEYEFKVNGTEGNIEEDKVEDDNETYEAIDLKYLAKIQGFIDKSLADAGKKLPIRRMGL